MKRKICGIYKITSPSKKVYIGQSVNINQRFNYYKSLKCDRQPKLFYSLKKHGVKKHKFEIVCECLPEELNNKEVYYINLFQTFNNKHGLNLMPGGSIGTKGLLVSQSTRDKLRVINLGKKHTPETIKKMREFQKNRFAQIKYVSSRNFGGFTVSEETREKLRKANTGKVQNNSYHKLTPVKATKIREMYSSGNYLQIELATMFNVSRPTISNTVREKGIIWKNGI